MRRSPRLLAVAGLGLLVLAACGPGADGPLLSDAREVVGRTIAATAPLRTVRVRFDATMQQAPQQGIVPNPGPNGGWLEAEVDLARQELSAHGAASDGSSGFEVIVADGALFVKNTSTG